MPIKIPAKTYNMELPAGNATAAKKSSGAKAGEVLLVPFGELNVLDDFNVRVTGYAGYETEIKELMASIRENGFYRHHPLAAFVLKTDDGADKYVLNDGHRRFEAVSRLRAAAAKANDEKTLETLSRLPVVLQETGKTLLDMTVELVTGNSGKQLNPFEKATVVGRLLDMGLKNDDIATRLAVTPRYIGDLKILLTADDKLVEGICTGKISATEAIALIREQNKGGGEAAAALAAGEAAAAADGKEKVTRKHVIRQKTQTDKKEYTYDAEQVLGKDSTLQIDIVKLLSGDAMFKRTTGGQKAVKKLKLTLTVSHKVDADAGDDDGLNDPTPTGDDDGLNDPPAATGDLTAEELDVDPVEDAEAAAGL